MKVFVVGIIAIGLVGCASKPSRRPTPADTLLSGSQLPAEVQQQYARFARMDIDGFGIPPVLFIGELDHVDPKSYMNVHGEEWAVVIRVKRVLIGSYSESIWGYGTPVPARVPFVKGREYYFVAGLGRHGSLLLHWTPVDQTPNKAPEPTSGIVTPRAEPRVAPIPPVAHL